MRGGEHSMQGSRRSEPSIKVAIIRLLVDFAFIQLPNVRHVNAAATVTVAGRASS